MMKKKMIAMMTMCLVLAGCGTGKAENLDASDVLPDYFTDAGQVEELAMNEVTYMEPNTGYTIVAPSWNGHDSSIYFHTDAMNYRKNIHVTQYSGDFGYDWTTDVVDISKHKDSTDILEVLFPQFEREDISTLPGGTWYTNLEYEILFTENINGIEMTKFQGTFERADRMFADEENSVYSFVAYGIDASQVPVLVIGYDTHSDIEEYGETFIPELSETLDKMVKTFQDGTNTYEKIPPVGPALMYDGNKGCGSFELGSGYKIYSPEEISEIVNNLEISHLSCKKNIDGVITKTYLSLKNNSAYPITRDLALYLNLDLIIGDKKYDADIEWVDEQDYTVVVLEEKLKGVESLEGATVEVSVPSRYNVRAEYTNNVAVYSLDGTTDIVLNSSEHLSEGDYILHEDGHISKLEMSIEGQEEATDGLMNYKIYVGIAYFPNREYAFQDEKFYDAAGNELVKEDIKTYSDIQGDRVAYSSMGGGNIHFYVGPGFSFEDTSKLPAKFVGRIAGKEYTVDLLSLYEKVK